MNEKSEGIIREVALPKFIDHKIAQSNSEPVTAVQYEYVLAGNGLLLRGRRNEFTACLALSEQPIKNLPPVETGILWHVPKIEPSIWLEVLTDARSKSDITAFREAVYAIYWDDQTNEWRWREISRERRYASAIADDTSEEYSRACIELHTHPTGAIHFSRADDRDETGKFRIFGILIDIHSPRPKIRFRCGIYHYFRQIPAGYISEFPAEIIDLNRIESDLERILS